MCGAVVFDPGQEVMVQESTQAADDFEQRFGIAVSIALDLVQSEDTERSGVPQRP